MLIANFFSIFVAMHVAKADIIRQLQREILPLEGLKILPSDLQIDLGFPSLEQSFPHQTFPVGCIHEFINHKKEDTGAAYGFISFLLSKLMKHQGTAIWISATKSIFPNALTEFGVVPEDVIFIHPRRSKDLLWTVEEALKCNRFAAVIGEVNEISFTESRRLQLAAEKSRVTGFIHRQKTGTSNQVACVSQWEITPLPSQAGNELPGVGFCRWQVDLKKIRNGRPGRWSIEWRPEGIHTLHEEVYALPARYRMKTG